MESLEIRPLVDKYNQCIIWRDNDKEQLIKYAKDGNLISDYKKVLQIRFKLPNNSPERRKLDILKDAYNEWFSEYLK